MNRRAFFVSLLLLMGLAWGSTQPLGKIAVSGGYRQFGLIFWQLVIGGLVLGTVVLLRGRAIPLNRSTLGFAAIIALIGTIIPNSAFYYSVVHLPAGIMSILISTVPLLAFPIALMLRTDRFSPARALGLFLGLVGVLLIAVPASSLPSRAMVAYLPIALIGPLFYALESNYVGRYGTAGMDAVQAMFLASCVGAVMVLPLALGSGQFINPVHPWGRADWALVGSSVVHAVAYTTFVWLASQAGAVFAAQTSYFVTGTGVIWAMLLLGERFSGWVWAALVVMLLGMALVQPREKALLGV